MVGTIEKQNYWVHPQKFMMWLFLVTVVMIFAGLTSAYIVQMSFLKPEERILFRLPGILWSNAALVLFSSFTMQYAMYSLRKQAMQQAIIGIVFTFALGIAFLIGQIYGMGEMAYDAQLPMVDNRRKDNLVAYFYIFISLHGLHLVAALIAAFVAIFIANSSRWDFRRKLLTYELITTFWHFLTILWVYLFVFLLYTQK